ncbi:hypothetical protein B9G55_16575 [Saccharibacillus sp. O16]|nr:hypothetical protein B9G55_16575 [Saccharibacillus sp. O16]
MTHRKSQTESSDPRTLSDPHPYRSRISLNGEWDFMPLYNRPQELSLPTDLVYEKQKVKVPSSWRGSYESRPGYSFGRIEEYDYGLFAPYDYPQEWDCAEAGLLRRSFTVPQSWAGRRIVLRLDGVMQQAAVYLDGIKLTVWRDGYLPLRLDITPYIQPGEKSELQVVCANFDKTAIPSGAVKVTGLTGSWFGYLARGLWQDVWLESYPPLAIETLAVRTSVREGQLQIEANIGAGLGFRQWDDALTASLKVRRAGRPHDSPLLTAQAEVQLRPSAPSGGDDEDSARFLRLCENDDAAPPGQIQMQLDWADAEWWSPDSPILYEAELELVQGGTILDVVTERFGFREFWNEGPEFMLNGIPVRLRGDSWHFQGPTQQTEAYVRTWYAMCREVGVNVIRLHAEPYPDYFLEIADEMGMMLVSETAIYGSGKSMAADHPDYILNSLEHVRRLVRRDRNHPSVVMWSVENEMRWVDGRDEFKRHIPVLIDAMKQLDPTRLIAAEGDNRLLSQAATEVESRHYNIDGTIEQWDRRVPLTFGEHGSWWYICPQNASMYIGLRAYRHTDESVRGLAEKERLFVEYARRQGVSGISTFNFAHYFMRAMPERDIALTWDERESPGVKPDYIPAYSLTLNNGLLPPDYPAYTPNPAFAIMKEAFRPAALIAAQYDRAFFDDREIVRSFDVYNDTLIARQVTVEFVVSQGGRERKQERIDFHQQPAERRTAEIRWMPEPIGRPTGLEQPSSETEETSLIPEIPSLEQDEEVVLMARLYHDGQLVHELKQHYRLFSAGLRSERMAVEGSSVYIGSEDDYNLLKPLLPDCSQIAPEDLEQLSVEALLIVGSFIRDEEGELERGIQAFAARGGRVLILEQDVFSLGRLKLNRRDFIRAHAGSYDHPIFAGLGDDDLIFWDSELREEGPAPIATAAFEKPAAGDYRLLLECSAGDFGDGGDLWTPLLEYRSGRGYLLANQLGLMSRFASVPQACLLLRRLLAHAGRAHIAAPVGALRALNAPRGGAEGSAVPARFLGGRGGMAERLLAALRLPCEPLRRGSDLSALSARLVAASERSGSAQPPEHQPGFGSPAYTGDAPGAHAPASAAPGGEAAVRPQPGLLIVEPAMLREAGVPEAARAFAAAGGAVVVLPCDEGHGEALTRLLDRPVRVVAHEAYQLEADYSHPLSAGLSPADLFGLDKVHHSPRDVENLPLGLHRIDADDLQPICVSVEGTAWKDYFVHKHTAEHSRLALVELNRDRARTPGNFVVEIPFGEGRIICSQIPLRPELDKNLRVYTRLLGNLGAAFADDLWSSAKDNAHYAIEAMMALPCEPYQDEQAMRQYYTDPDFSLNNLGEGLYGWMKKKERSPQDGLMRIADSAGGLWFLSAFIQLPEPRAIPSSEIDCEERSASLRRLSSAAYWGRADAEASSSVESGSLERSVRLRVEGHYAAVELWLNGRRLPAPAYTSALRSGINRLIVIARGGTDDLALAVYLEYPDGRPMDDLRYRMTIDEVQPK